MGKEIEGEKHIVASSHQGHFFPWLGYLDKMARCDYFILNDVCQITLKSPMMRNKVLDTKGNWHYFNLTIKKDNYMQLENRFIELRCWDEDKEKIEGLFRMCYGHAPFWREIWGDIEKRIFSKEYKFIIDAQLDTISYLKECFGIKTRIVRQSTLDCHEMNSKSMKIVEKVKKVGADIYLAGNGAKKYLEPTVVENNGIKLIFQNFKHPQYPQKFSNLFIGNMSSVDMLFNCGKENSRKYFWDNIAVERVNGI